MKSVTRASGRSAVAAAAYRSGTRLVNERDGLVHDYTRKGGIEHAQIVVPEGQGADWARDREALWNAAEFAEKRKDARVAREFEVALPHELTGDERLELVRSFSQGLAERYGVAVDFALHVPDRDMDVRNHHAHILITTRQVGPDGLGEKTDLERENKWLKVQGRPTTDVQLKAVRLEWEESVNLALGRAGHDIRVDHRSHEDRGLEIEPTAHVGVHAHQMAQRGKEVERERLAEEARVRNADLIRENPDQVLALISGEKSVFDRRDVARCLHRYINDDPAEYQALFTRVMGSDQLVTLAGGKDGEGARYSTRELVALETGMARQVVAMSGRDRHRVSETQVERAIERQDEAIRRSVAAGLPETLTEAERGLRLAGVGTSEEQRLAVRHLTGAEQVSVVVGFAGAGKSTLLAAAREAWEAEGYRVQGAALAGKAVAGLEETAGIAGRTLASWEMRWQMGTAQLGPKDVLVIDEAGMVGSRQLAKFVSEAEHTGAKIVLVGDHEQLQAIGAGAPFRAIAEAVGYVSVEDVRRQRTDWQREASRAFATTRTEEGLSAYQDHGAIHLVADQDRARAQLVRDYVEDVQTRPEGTRAAMAHRRVDVRQLNDDIRDALKAGGRLSGGEVSYATELGERAFTAGDRIVFLQNDRGLDVKNGTLGTVERVEAGRLVARIDGPGGRGEASQGRSVEINANAYKAFDHGYATTIHKTQGATVDRAYVLASNTMDRHMTYVAMTRHRDQAQLYAGQDQFADMASLTSRLGRSGARETVLDYVDRDGRRLDTGEAATGASAGHTGDRGTEAFARRRGIDSEIVWPVARQRGVVTAKERGESREAISTGSLAPSYREETPQSGKTVLARDRDTNMFGREGGKSEAVTSIPASDGPAQRRETISSGEWTRDPDRIANRTGVDKGEKSEAVTSIPASDSPAQRRESGDRVNVPHDTDRIADRAGVDKGAKLASSTPRQQYEAALEVYAEAGTALANARLAGQPVPADQVQALREAGATLDRLRPGSQALFAQTLRNDRQTAEAMRDLRGPERVQRLIYGMALEEQRQAGRGQEPSAAETNATPEQRANRLVKAWRELGEKRATVSDRFGDRARLDRDMRQLAESVRQDPEVERLLAERARDLGMDLKGRTVSEEMERQIRQRDRGIER